ncbi:hypothetical protein V6N11_050049 [Hibiscus sabdariffa]|uniref:Uncharacterized protein n=2 Tax=Hibiscus sabdariffa TaxID=183260 RepID=A0ABR2ALS3_9ROSI
MGERTRNQTTCLPQILRGPMLQRKPKNLISKMVSCLDHGWQEPKLPTSLPEGNIRDTTNEKERNEDSQNEKMRGRNREKGGRPAAKGHTAGLQ